MLESSVDGNHPFQPHISKKSELEENNLALLSFGDPAGSELQVLFCTFCRTAVPGCEIKSHWSAGTHPEGSRPSSERRKSIIRQFPDTIESAIEIAQLQLRPVGQAQELPDEISGLITSENGFECAAPLCGYLCTSEATFRTHKTKVHKKNGTPMPDNTPVTKLQTLGRRFDWPYFRVNTATPTPALMQQVYSDFFYDIPSDRIKPLSNMMSSLPLHVTLGWASTIDGFHGDTTKIQALRATTSIPPFDPLGSLRHFSSTYLARVGLECLRPEGLKLASAVINERG